MIEMTADVERDLARGLIMVRLTGVLTTATRAKVTTAVASCLAESPTAVIVDLTDLTFDSPIERAVLLRLDLMAGREPAVALLWCATPGSIGAQLARLTPGARIYPDVAGAIVSVLSGPNSAHWAHFPLTGTVDSPAEARLLVGDACLRWGLDHIADDARLVISELVTNAVDHACGEIVVTARTCAPYLVTTVRDRSTVPPVKVVPGPVPMADVTVAERGRGLHILDLYATAWGYVLTDDGKAVWASLRTHPLETR